MTRVDLFESVAQIAVEPALCGLCGSRNARPFAVSYDYEYRTCSNEWRFVQCQECDTVYLNPRPAQSTLATIYPTSYYSYNYDQRINVIARQAKAFLDRRTLAWALGLLEIPLLAYCDVGCGDGRYLRTMAHLGGAQTRLHGTELDENVVARLAAEGFLVEKATIEDATGLPVAGLQLITMFSVLEHVGDPARVLGKAASLLSQGGLLVAEVPNPRSLNARLFRDRYWGGYHTPRHWNLFTVEALAAAGERVGLTLKTVRRTTGHAFWLFSLHHYLRYELGWDRLGALLNPATCLPGVAAATALDLVRARWGGETDNMLVVLKRD